MNQRDPVEGYEEHLEPLIRGARERRLEAEAVGEGRTRDGRRVSSQSPRAKL